MKNISEAGGSSLKCVISFLFFQQLTNSLSLSTYKYVPLGNFSLDFAPPVVRI